jgi:hypothetical protein
MPRKGQYSTNWFDKDDGLWVLTGNVTFGGSGSYFDPPEGDDVELLTAQEELDPGFHGPCRKLDFDDFVQVVGAKDSDVEHMHYKLAEEAHEFNMEDEDEREPDYDEVHPEHYDSLDRFDTEY